MQEITKIINDESGAMLIGVLLVLVAVTAIGVTLTNGQGQTVDSRLLAGKGY
jgi:Flp pilus assembly pilin Flp